ncbi:MAG: hypothetical protein JNM31_09285 [Flavobacteriales bacterium]|nr:hypothetical protein [Flavobacteriales bacterium]
MIGTLFGKKRITEEKVAHAFVNAMLDLAADGFATMAEELNEAPEFGTRPVVDTQDTLPFGLILLAGNLMEAPCHLESGQDRRFAAHSISIYSEAIGMRCSDLEQEVQRQQALMRHLNHPSKNTVYAMSKLLFHAYDLFRFQEPYFRDQRAPNPILLKRINGMMAYFLWDWTALKEEYRITH